MQRMITVRPRPLTGGIATSFVSTTTPQAPLPATGAADPKTSRAELVARRYSVRVAVVPPFCGYLWIAPNRLTPNLSVPSNRRAFEADGLVCLYALESVVFGVISKRMARIQITHQDSLARAPDRCLAKGSARRVTVLESLRGEYRGRCPAQFGNGG